MADAKDIWVSQSPKAMAKGEAHAYIFDFSRVGDGTPPSSINSEIAYDAGGTDRSSTVLSGAMSLSGFDVVSKLFTPGAHTTPVGNWRLVISVQISGNTVFSAMDIAVFDPVPAAATVPAGTYGSIAGVASFVPRHASRAGTFDDTTRPSSSTIVELLGQVSSVMNAMLNEVGFTTPITTAAILPAFNLFVNQEVAALVEGINGSGRFGPSAKGGGGRKGRFSLMLEDVAIFIESNANGFDRMGAERTYSLTSGLAFRDTDSMGDDVPPIFGRKAFNEVYRDWELD